jgi:hypothetical protein
MRLATPIAGAHTGHGTLKIAWLIGCDSTNIRPTINRIQTVIVDKVFRTGGIFLPPLNYYF